MGRQAFYYHYLTDDLMHLYYTQSLYALLPSSRMSSQMYSTESHCPSDPLLRLMIKPYFMSIMAIAYYHLIIYWLEILTWKYIILKYCE